MKLDVDFTELHKAVSKMNEVEIMDNDGEVIELARKQAIEADLCCSKSRLKDEFRMKPKPDAVPIKYYKNDFGKSYGVYRITDCVPMKARAKNISEKQILNAKRLGLRTQLNSKAGKAGKIVERLISESALVLDTETTGLGFKDQIIEIGICDLSGRVLMNQRIRPTVGISEGAFEKHGISQNDLENCPTWPEVVKSVKDILTGRKVVIFNADFDLSMLKQTCNAFGVDGEWIRDLDVECAMKISAMAFGATNRYGSISLDDASYFAQVTWKGNAHCAIADSIMTADILNSIHQSYMKNVNEFNDLNFGNPNEK
ncbi:3'-5' exonuclease [Vibrio parahaemolyticus]|uniref:3'-5' exonuclease n=1 Tax=Vibrio parahaemolyticus TaxID=670 RepID=UPI000404B5F1|nr:3'-5' exonuclease [Vibrio parahaemolyticus]